MTYIREINDLSQAIENYPKLASGRYIRDTKYPTHLRGKGGKFYPGQLEGQCWNHKRGGWEQLSPDMWRRLYRKLTKRKAHEHHQRLSDMKARYQQLMDRLKRDPVYRKEQR